MTLAQAFENIVAFAKGSQLDDSLLVSIKNETNYIKRKFDINPMECVILAVLLDDDTVMTRREIANFLECSSLKVLALHDCFEHLRRKKMIYISCIHWISLGYLIYYNYHHNSHFEESVQN